MKALIAITSFIYFTFSIPIPVFAESKSLLISEFQTGSSNSASDEFIELYNPNSTNMSLEGVVVQYKSASGTSWQTKASLDGWIAARGYFLLSTEGYIDEPSETFNPGLASSGGHIRLYTSDFDYEHDKVGWGPANEPETEAIDAPAKDESAKRVLDEDGKFMDTDNNKEDFFISNSPSPELTVVEVEEDPEVEPQPEEQEPEENIETPIEEPDPEEDPNEIQPQSYPSVQISELFVDPEAPLTDSEDEYVELFNPNGYAVSLKDYQLVTGTKSTYSYIFSDISIEPGQYLTLYSKDTGLTLSNSQGGARLLSPSGDVLFETDEYQDAKAGEAWVFKDGVWQWSSSPTPGVANSVTKPSAKTSKAKSTKKKTSRKKASTKSKSIKGAKDDSRSVYGEPATVPADINTVVLVGVGGLAVLYALYEYRHDIGNTIYKVRRYFSSRG